MNTLLLFIVLNVVNVILQTIKSICTVKCGKVAASVVNAVAYGLYTVVLVYMNCDLSLWAKVAVVGGANLIGVYVVKVLEEKAQKDKLWKVEATIKKNMVETLHTRLNDYEISHNYIYTTDDNVIFNCFCKTKAESANVKELLEFCNAKFFVTESKAL